MKVFTSPKDYLIPIIRDLDGKFQNDFYLRLIAIENDLNENIILNSISFILFNSKKEILKEIKYTDSVLEKRAKDSVEELNIYRENIIYECLGIEKFWNDGSLTTSLEIEPNKQFVVMAEYFNLITYDNIEKMEVVINYSKNNKQMTQTYDIYLKAYESKNQYIFPLRGTWIVTDIYSSIDSHRWCYNSEFAFDVGQLNKDFMLIHKENMENKEYTHYGKDIIAIGDGRVVEVYNDFPEYSLGYKNKMERSHYDELEKVHGPIPRSAGNYVVIEHENKEYSFYCHMIPNSVQVKKGQKVKAGEVLGKLGSSGNSNCPHLHFHLMDGPNKLTSRGLPCSFINIKNITNEKVDFINEDSMIIKTF
ncbi:MAG: M23 family metallopeptidase [Clostridium argentinense]|uniref:M23 family metallopeptidase n=1 Tax=Clostridium faecium TaxID=2762223 RepID=A0ABR8YP24_9CLOT|nr:M23 family metallopeptidase [Clostridium faecium]MBD8045997.1 M23 family metallopeptidase [Clostridium faecium]MBS5824488.1 M23 family metallopeptidase [Clostridium argentinense]